MGARRQGVASGLSTAAGCGSKVTTPSGLALFRASSAALPITPLWPRFTPSKLPSATEARRYEDSNRLYLRKIFILLGFNIDHINVSQAPGLQPPVPSYNRLILPEKSRESSERQSVPRDLLTTWPAQYRGRPLPLLRAKV